MGSQAAYSSPGAASTRYPNVYAEYEAGVAFGNLGARFCRLHHLMGVTEALAAAIMDGTEEITAGEALTLRKSFLWSTRQSMLLGYLFNDRLSMMPPEPWRREERIYILRIITEVAGRTWPPRWNQIWLEKAQGVLEAMEQGQPVTYAFYQNALTAAEYMIADYGERTRQPRNVGSS